MKRWLVALMLFAASNAFADPFPITDAERSVAGHTQWLNTSRPLTPDDLRGRIILLDFWTLGCINCMDIIPDLKALEQEFGANLTVIGVHSAKFANEKDTDNIRNAILRYGLTHPVVNDGDFTTWNAFGVKAWPTLVLMDPTGKVVKVYAGEGHRSELESDIKAVMTQYKGQLTTTPLPIALESEKQATTLLRFPGKVIAANMYGTQKKSYSVLYVADSGHNRIVVEDLSGNIMQVVGSEQPGLKNGDFRTAQFFKPQGMAYKDGLLYVADLGNHALRVVDFNTQTVSTLAGTGQQGRFLEDDKEHDATKTALSSPWDVAFWPDANHLAVAMAGAHQIWSYDLGKRTFTLLAGNGQEGIDDGRYPFASLAQPSGLFAGKEGRLYFADAESSALRLLDTDGNVTTLIGKGLFDFGYKQGGKDEALLQHDSGLTGDGDNLYIADTYNHSIRRYDLKEGKLHDYAGHNARGKVDGALAQASFDSPGGIALSDGKLYIADTDNSSLRTVDMKTGTVATLTGAVAASAAVTPPPSPVAAAAPPVLAKTSGPNPSNLFFYVAPGAPVDVTLKLQEGWHVNDTAPSQLSLLGKDGTPLLGFGLEMVKTDHLRLPPLKDKANYHLDGIVYYCSSAKDSLCMIKSLNVTILTTGKDTTITLPVN